MKIYVPNHLRNIEIVKQFCDLIEKYSVERNNELSKSKNSSYYYHYYKSLTFDPVKKFIGICKFNAVSGDSVSNIINYLTTVFYSIKGTIKIFEYLKSKLGIDCDYTYNISTGDLYIKLKKSTYSIFIENEELYRTSFENFIKSLLFVKRLNIIYENAETDSFTEFDLVIGNKSNAESDINTVNVDIKSCAYNKINITIEDNL